MKLTFINRQNNLWLLEQAVLLELGGRNKRYINEAIFTGLALLAAKSLVSKLISFFSKKREEDGKPLKNGKLKPLLYKLIKKVGLAAFICAIVYCGFQFDLIRDISPALTEFIDGIGQQVFEYGKQALQKMAIAMPNITYWMVNSMALAGIGAARKAVRDIIDHIDVDRQGPQVWRPGYTVDPRFPNAEDTRTGMKPGDYVDPRNRNWERDHDIYNDVKDEFDDEPSRIDLDKLFDDVDKYLSE